MEQTVEDGGYSIGKLMAKMQNTPINPEVAAVFDSYPKKIRTRLMVLRQFILDVAASLESVGEIEETLKWGEPSYLTPQTKSGSTIRIAWKKASDEKYSIYFKCTADLVPAFKKKYPDIFKYGGKRSIDFAIDDKIPAKALKNCLALALTYHRNKKLAPEARWEMVEKSLRTANADDVENMG